MKRLLTTVAVVLLLWAAVAVPLPLTAVEPVPARPVNAIIDLEDGLPDDIPDGLRFTAVQIRQPTAFGAVLALLDQHAELTDRQAFAPPGIDPEEFGRFQERLFRESIQTAVAMGLDAAGREVTISGDGARVVATIPDGPADGELQEDDVITMVDGRDVALASGLAAMLVERRAGAPVELTIRRDGEQRTVTLELAPLDPAAETGRVGLGVLVATVDPQIGLPVGAEPAEDARIGGPSAGLMLALGVYDAATEGTLVGDRIVAGTGTIDLSGNVGPVDGIATKVRGAVLADAEVFLIPESLAAEARAAAPDDLEVVAVTSLDEAIDALTE